MLWLHTIANLWTIALEINNETTDSTSSLTNVTEVSLIIDYTEFVDLYTLLL